jgi:hypothetical protein
MTVREQGFIEKRAPFVATGFAGFVGDGLVAGADASSACAVDGNRWRKQADLS